MQWFSVLTVKEFGNLKTLKKPLRSPVTHGSMFLTSLWGLTSNWGLNSEDEVQVDGGGSPSVSDTWNPQSSLYNPNIKSSATHFTAAEPEWNICHSTIADFLKTTLYTF